jgi:NADH-quinone oxidoreductase subunit E/NADP-reducing hydrogenase subunit HndA
MQTKSLFVISQTFHMLYADASVYTIYGKQRSEEGGKEMALAFDMNKNAKKVEELKKIIESKKDDKGAVMPVLHAAQEMFGYLPIEIQKMISEEMNVPLAEIYGVATFYSRFSLNKKGEYVVGVCLGTACYVKGAQGIIDNVKKELNIEVGQTTPDLKFSLEATRCIGACGLAPVMTVNEDVYGKLLASDVADILKKYQ